jgi:exocyst complex component 5
MFMDVNELRSAPTYASIVDGDPGAALAAIRSLVSLYKGLLATMKEEAVVIDHVFPNPAAALSIFVQRIFEQRIQVRRGVLDGGRQG